MKQKVKLKDIASYSKGSQINGTELIENGEFDYLNGGINPSGKWNEANCNADTIAISEGGNSCGYVNYMRKPFWCGAHCYYLYDTVANTKYLYYALKSQQERIMKLRSGACMPSIKKSDLGNIIDGFYIGFKMNLDSVFTQILFGIPVTGKDLRPYFGIRISNKKNEIYTAELVGLNGEDESKFSKKYIELKDGKSSAVELYF